MFFYWHSWYNCYITIDKENEYMNISMIYTTTEYAGKARALRVCDIISKAAAMKAQTVITADPDTMCAAPEIITAAHDQNMRASVGIKLTLCEYGHLGQIALIPKNYSGFIAIGKLFESASRTGNTRHPTITLNDLEKHFRPCTMGYENVIVATCG